MKSVQKGARSRGRGDHFRDSGREVRVLLLRSLVSRLSCPQSSPLKGVRASLKEFGVSVGLI